MAYSTLAEIRAMTGLADDTVYTDSDVNAAISLADEDIDRYTWTSWEYKAFTSTLSGNSKRSIQLLDDEGRPILYPQTLTSVTIDGVVVADTSGWKLYPEGVIIRDTGSFTCDAEGRNVVIVGTAGKTDSSNTPDGIKWCSRRLARYELLREESRVDERALNLANDFGTVVLAMPGGKGRPTSLPEVNARLNSYRQMSQAWG